jgi:hypothetical protein
MEGRLTRRDLDREAAYADFVEALRRDPGSRKRRSGLARRIRQRFAWTARPRLREAQGANDASRSARRFRGRAWARTTCAPASTTCSVRFGDLDRMFETSSALESELRQHGAFPHNGFTDEHQGIRSRSRPTGREGRESRRTCGASYEKKTYEAKSLEELYDAHPVLKDKIGAHRRRLPRSRTRWLAERHGRTTSFNRTGPVAALGAAARCAQRRILRLPLFGRDAHRPARRGDSGATPPPDGSAQSGAFSTTASG